MKYFLDTEFLEGSQARTFLGFRVGETKPTIDLISIGIVAEDGREYYAISKDFNLKEAWNRFDLVVNKSYPLGPEYNKVYWLRENVLRSIFHELLEKSMNDRVYMNHHFNTYCGDFNYSHLNILIQWYGKSNKEIAEEVKEFCHFWKTLDSGKSLQNHPIQFYAYFADYDWVVFCWLFGKMIDLPKGFPYYCKDLKQMLDEWSESHKTPNQSGLEYVKGHREFPKQENEHNALDDARWNKKLYELLLKISPYGKAR